MRAHTEVEKRLLDLIEPEASELGLQIVRVSMSGGQTPILQIMAERPDGGMNVELCARLSRRLSPIFDEQDPISGHYTLEVSSPGIDRPLTRPGDFANWVGHEARVEVGIPVEGRRRFHGVIESETDGVVALALKDGAVANIPIQEMVKARLVLTDKLIEDAQSRGQVPDTEQDNFDEIVDELNQEIEAEGAEPEAEDDQTGSKP